MRSDPAYLAFTPDYHHHPGAACSSGMALQLHTVAHYLNFPGRNPATPSFPVPYQHPPQRQLIAGFIKLPVLVRFLKIYTFDEILIVLL